MKSGLKVSTYTAMKSGLVSDLCIVSTYTAMKSGLKVRTVSTYVSTYTAMKSGLKAQKAAVKSQPIAD